jgi:hypothetical protein
MGGRGGGRTGGRRGAPRDSAGNAPRMLSTQDILKNSPLRLLLDKKKDLALTDMEQADLVNRQFALDQQLLPLLDQVDSAESKARPSGDARSMSEDERRALMEQMRAMRTTMTAIRAQEDSATTAAVATLTAEQRLKANELLRARREDLQKRERR